MLTTVLQGSAQSMPLRYNLIEGSTMHELNSYLASKGSFVSQILHAHQSAATTPQKWHHFCDDDSQACCCCSCHSVSSDAVSTSIARAPALTTMPICHE